MKILLLSLFLAVPACAQTTSPTPVVPTKFDWKLRLTKGQTWTQTTETRSTSGAMFGGSPVRFTSVKTVTFRNEVLDATPAMIRVRTSIEQFDTLSEAVPEKLFNSPPMTSFESVLVGGIFTWKQAPSGRVFDVQGVEELVARQKKVATSLGKTPAQRAAFLSSILPAELLSAVLTGFLSITIPDAPLSPGQAFLFTPQRSWVYLGSRKIKRTLSSFDGQSARFDDNAEFEDRGNSIGTQDPDLAIQLTRDAAQLFLARSHRVSADATPVYLSKNGRVYYRNARNPREVIWLDPPPSGIWLKPLDAAKYNGIRGYNNRVSGRTLAEVFNSRFFGLERAKPLPPISFTHHFSVIRGTLSGKTTVAPTGLISHSKTTLNIHGRNVELSARGKEELPLWSSVQVTVTSQ